MPRTLAAAIVVGVALFVLVVRVVIRRRVALVEGIKRRFTRGGRRVESSHQPANNPQSDSGSIAGSIESEVASGKTRVA